MGNRLVCRDRLGPQDLLDRERKAGAGLDRGVVGHHHDPAPVHRADHREHARGRRSTPFGVDLEPGPQAQLERRVRPGRATARSARARSCAPSRAGVRWPRHRPPGEAFAPSPGLPASRQTACWFPGPLIPADEQFVSLDGLSCRVGATRKLHLFMSGELHPPSPGRPHINAAAGRSPR